MITEGYEENVDRNIRRSLYCKHCNNETLSVDGRLTDMMSVQYRCYCNHCGMQGTALYSFDGEAAALESNAVGILPLDVAEVLAP